MHFVLLGVAAPAEMKAAERSKPATDCDPHRQLGPAQLQSGRSPNPVDHRQQQAEKVHLQLGLQLQRLQQAEQDYCCQPPPLHHHHRLQSPQSQ